MPEKHNKRIPPNATKGVNGVPAGFIPVRAHIAHAFGLNEQRQGIHVSLKYYQSEYQCFSEWQASELRHFSSLLKTLRELNLLQLRTHHGIQMKAPKGKLRLALPPAIAPLIQDISIVELRVSQTVRVHGFVIDPAFFLVWLDRNHDVFPE